VSPTAGTSTGLSGRRAFAEIVSVLEKGCEEIGSALESRPEVARPPKVTLLRPEDPAVPQCARSRGGPPPPLKQTAYHPLDPPISLHVHIAAPPQLWVEGSDVSCRSVRWWPDKSSRAAGQVFEPDRPYKSLHVLGRRPKTKTLVTGLGAAGASDMPSKPVWGRELPGGFDSRPPPRGENGEMSGSRWTPCSLRSQLMEAIETELIRLMRSKSW